MCRKIYRLLLVMVCLLSVIGLEVIYSQRERIAELEAQMSFYKKQTVVIYQVDNAGAEMVGKVTDKEVVDGHPTVTIGAYGKFLVTSKQYDEIEVGDDIPDYLKGRDTE